jgi:hypothetical protein
MVAYVTYRRAPLAMLLAGVALLGMAACSKLGLGGGDDQMTWAKAALERNGRLEVVAADPQTSTFTVRVKDTGELRMIKADQVVAEPAGLSAPSGAAPTETSAPSEPAAPAQPAPESSGVNTPTATASTNSPPEQSSMTRPADETAANVPRPPIPTATLLLLPRVGGPSNRAPATRSR